MKKILGKLFMLFFIAGIISSCHKLDVPITTEVTPSVFPQDSLGYIQTELTPYVALDGYLAQEYFFQQSYSTDEAIMPAHGGNWYDGAQNMQMHYHSWTKDNGYLNGNWGWMSVIVSSANQAISILTTTMPAGTNKQMKLAELKLVRDYAIFMLMDNWGNVPLDTLYGDFNPHPNIPRAQVFAFLENDIKNTIPYLSTTVDQTTYGRFTAYGAYALLAKMYLNAEYYTGTARYNDCIAACDNIISSGKFNITARSNYLVMFYPSNGPTSPGSEDEFIFAVPFNSNGSGWYGRSANYHARYDVPRSMGKVAAGAGYNYFGLPYDPSGPASTLPEFYANFNDSNDVRNGQWLTGLQWQDAAKTIPLTVTTTNVGYDQYYSGNNPGGSYTYQVNLVPNVVLRQDIANGQDPYNGVSNGFDVGNDEIAWTMGYRNIKFHPDASSSSRNQNNDIPIFRYSDIILMKAEAILRGGSATNGSTPLSLVNSLRANRTTSPAWSDINLDSVYNERCRELTWEGWHRNDMIRFGKFEGSWGYKTNADTYRRIFPIPTSALTLNPSLKQNPGY
ncbi:MAG TPA: RagB/SusD family nutrient uptake outer membrane protein [Puia sp.]|nr:RagB/SusD family nutrient uptake outer membrane protein [Puia sp.]